MKMKYLTELKRYLKENKLSIFLSVIAGIIYFIFNFVMTYAKIISSFTLFPINAIGYYGGHNVSINIDILIGIIMALVLLIHKRKFASLKEIVILSFWSSLFLTITSLLMLDILLVYFAGLSQMLDRLAAWILANLIGVIWFTIVFTVVSIIINGLYLKVKKRKR